MGTSCTIPPTRSTVPTSECCIPSCGRPKCWRASLPPSAISTSLQSLLIQNNVRCMFSYHQFRYYQRLDDIPIIQSYITVHYSFYFVVSIFNCLNVGDAINIYQLYIHRKCLQTLASSNN